MTLFSLVIPTLRRADTLRHALATAVAQDWADCEIVVQNNGADAAVAQVVAACGDPRVRAYATPDVLPMADNWERALDNARGRYLAFIGDDDGFLPDACTVAARAIAATDAEIVSWLPFLYYWPDFPEPGRRNRLIAHVDGDPHLVRHDSRRILRQVYRWQLDYSALPMIYNSFVARSVIERACARLGRYFIGWSPDVTSGAVNAALCDRFVRLTRPLSVAGQSRHGTGYSALQRRTVAADDDAMVRDFGRMAIDPRLPAPIGLHTFVASDLLLVKDRLLGADPATVFDFKGLLAMMARRINESPATHAATVAAIEAIAAHHGIDAAQIAIPPPIDAPPPFAPATSPAGPHAARHVIDGDARGLATIDDAVKLAHALLPDGDPCAAAVVDALDADAGLPIAGGATLGFAAGGTGTAALERGWGEAEGWGTWAVDSPAVLRFIPHDGWAACTVELACRVLLIDARDRVTVSCRCNDRFAGDWSFARGETRRVLRFHVARHLWAAAGTLAIALQASPRRSPARLGASADVRELGPGIEWIRFAVEPESRGRGNDEAQADS